MTAEPSPRPWRVEKAADECRFWIVRKPDGVSIGMTWREADAALIVDAVNNADSWRNACIKARTESNAFLLERDRLRDIVRRLVEYADAITGYRPRTVEVLSSEHPAWTFDGAALLREARAAIGEDAR